MIAETANFDPNRLQLISPRDSDTGVSLFDGRPLFYTEYTDFDGAIELMDPRAEDLVQLEVDLGNHGYNDEYLFGINPLLENNDLFSDYDSTHKTPSDRGSMSPNEYDWHDDRKLSRRTNWTFRGRKPEKQPKLKK